MAMEWQVSNLIDATTICRSSYRHIPYTQDGQKLRRYRRRWKIERTIAWVNSFRRLIVRPEYYSFIYQGFIHLVCSLICLRRF
jgi:transposase